MCEFAKKGQKSRQFCEHNKWMLPNATHFCLVDKQIATVTIDFVWNRVSRAVTAPTLLRPTSPTCLITCSTSMTTASGLTLEVNHWRRVRPPKIVFTMITSNTTIPSHAYLSGFHKHCWQNFVSGPALKVLVNMQVRSMGPISETDMVSEIDVEGKIWLFFSTLPWTLPIPN